MKQHTHLTLIALFLMLGGAIGCKPTTGSDKQDPPQTTPPIAQGADVLTPQDAIKKHKTFDTYWYQGLAELTRYKLDQSRYGEVRDGEAVFIYVTEDFLKDKQVKYEFGDKSKAVSVLKLNAYRRFHTGLYPYTIMTSSFVPAKTTKPLKITTTVQEWCGQTFMQLNHKANQFSIELRSYFQAEGDTTVTLPNTTVSEDSLWNQVRHNPNALPSGTISITPAFHTLRMQHKNIKAYQANANLTPLKQSSFSKKPHLLYSLAYKNFPRHVNLYIEATFPHRIIAWQESTSTPLKAGIKTTGNDVTTATLTNSILLDYWSKNQTKHNPLRKLLRQP